MSLTERAVDFAWSKLKAAAEKVAEDEAKEGGKTLFTEAIKRIQPTNRERVAKSLLTSFARLLEDQCNDHQLFAAEGSQFADDAANFLANPSVQAWLAEPLDPGVNTLNYQRLSEVWGDLKLNPLPTTFEWDIVARRYLTKVRAAVQNDPALRAMVDHQTLDQIRSDLGRFAGLDPGFRLETYRSRIRTRYGYLKFDSFHVTGSDLERRVQLSKVFVPQNVKEDMPPLEPPQGAHPPPGGGGRA